ncbi:MAG: putative ABC transport system permease protein [Polaribacter sp.]|jgi:putative ABC transport system permease protein
MNSLSQLFTIAFRIFRRDWLRGDLSILVFALSIAMASVSIIYLIIDRVSSATDQQAAQIIGADLVITSPNEINQDWINTAKQLNLQSAKVISFASVLSANGKIQLSGVKAVSKNYPLKGRIELSDIPYAKTDIANQIPDLGSVWIAPRIYNQLSVKKGELIELGYAELNVNAVIMLEPGQGSSLFNIAPSAIINIQDLAKTKIIQPGSRVTYRYLFVGNKNDVEKFKLFLEPIINSSQRLVTIFDETPLAGSAITRSKKYISLSSILTLILLGIAIAITANRYATRQFDMSALMRCFGMNNRQVLTVFIFILGLVAVSGIMIGAVFGLGFQWLMVKWLSELFVETLPSPDLAVLLFPALSSLILLMGFAMPSLSQLKDVPPMRVLRRQLAPMKNNVRLIYFIAFISLLTVMYVQIGDFKLVLGVTAGLLVMALIFGVFAKLVLSQVRRLSNTGNVAVNYSLRQLDANKGVTLLHLLSFSSTLFVIAIVILVRTELLDKWQQSIAIDTPNHFMVNISPDKIADLSSLFKQNDVVASDQFPMVRARITKINGEDIKTALPESVQEHNSLKRELNMTWTEKLPKGNKITDGEWLTKTLSNEKTISNEKQIASISFDSQTAEILGLQINDQLTFTIGGREWTAEISSLRSIDWQTFTPNFYVIAKPGDLDDFSPTFMNAFYLPKEKKNLLAEIVKKYPTSTVIELDRIFDEVRKIIAKVSSAVEILMVFVVVAGLALLWATMEHSFAQKLKQSAILRTLGASRNFLAVSFRFEFLWIAILSSTVALICIELVTYFLYQSIFEIEFELHFSLWWQLPTALFALMLIASWRGVNRVTKPAPLLLLK